MAVVVAVAAAVPWPVLIAGAGVAAVNTGGSQAGGPVPPAVQPNGRLAGVYRQAAARRCPGLPWTLLAAIGWVESRHGGDSLQADTMQVDPPIIGPRLDGTGNTARIPDTDNGRLDHDTVFDRAVGPMQIIPETWQAHRLDGNRDGRADPNNAVDAAHTAAAYLCATGAPENLPAALAAYNPSSSYRAAVQATQQLLNTQQAPADPHRLAEHPNLTLTSQARRDLDAGLVDPQLARLLAAIIESRQVAVSVFKTGHSRHVAGTTTVSAHWCGRAVDLYAVAGQPVTADNDAARQLVGWLSQLPDPLRPAEVGSPWTLQEPLGGFFTDPAHQDHLHIATGVKCE